MNEGELNAAQWDTTGLTREQDLSVALCSMRNYAREHDLSGRALLDVFNAGLMAMHKARAS